MKHVFTVRAICTCVAFTFALHTACAQNQSLLFTSTMAMSEILARQFPAAENVVWSEVGKEHHAHFIQDGVDYRVRYSRRGRWLSTIRIIDPQKVPGNVVRQLGREYPQYEIFFAQHIKARNGQCWMLKVRSGKYWKELKTAYDQCELLGDYTDPTYPE